ncbi:MAG: PTS sugar transporter subunit IIB [Fusobacteriaceae bacterium]|jgi:PTS system cellobiose-specific IIB component|nr:PTS sugar transporter subunit IIB [Fusobacteriaceae bacterium]
MKKILLCCAAGMSTSLLVTKMQQAATEKAVESKIWAVSVEELQANLEGVDVVLLGPQIRYKLNEVRKICGDKIPSEVINMVDYGSMNGKKVLDFALDLIK